MANRTKQRASKMNKPSNNGGATAIRGFLVQTLVALLAIAQADPPFIEITLEPVEGEDKFDFTWSDASGRFAVQVKSSINQFSLPDATRWAEEMLIARSTAHCKLILVGHFHAKMEGVAEIITAIGTVAVEQKSLDRDGLQREAAHLLGKFMEAHGQHPGTAVQRELTVISLMGQLLEASANGATMTRDAFIAFLIACIGKAAQQQMPPDIDRITRYAPEHLIGREAETALLSTAWQQVTDNTTPRPHHRAHIISFVALGGEGKTALVADWAKQLALGDSPGWDAAFGWSFYSQGSEQQMAASSELFMYEALKFFGEAELAASNQSGVDKARRLAQVVGARRVLLILDGLEPLQYPPTGAMRGELRDKALAQLLRGLASKSLGLCVLTTRYSIPDLKAWRDTTAPEYKLTRLATAAGVALLRKLGVTGAQAECEKLVESVQGHALSIHLFGGYLRDAHGGDIRKRDCVTLADADAEEAGGHAWRVMDAYAQWLAGDGVHGRRALAVLKLLGLFDRPATGECIAALLQAPAIDGLTEDLVGLDEAARNIITTRLADAGLLTVQRGAGNALLALDAHPLIREYFALATAGGQAETWQAAHQRLYTYLCENTEDKDEPPLDDLQPLYQAVAHGCLAGMQQEACEDVYFARIVCEDKHHSMRKLGAFGTDLGAVACFFDQPWQRVSPTLNEGNQAWLLNQAGICLRALCRLTEAGEPMRATLAMDVNQERWKEAANSARNLSELKLALGDLAGAVRNAEQAVTHAERSGDAFHQIVTRTTLADALLQEHRADAATALFCEAEAMQTEREPTYPLLYSLWGFRYCDLLLAAPQAGAWRCSVQNGFDSVAVHSLEQEKTCQLVAQRAAQTLEWMERANIDLLSIALDHLTLGRAALFAAILVGQPLAPCQASLKLAVDGLRRSGNMDDLPRGLLTRAWHSAHTARHIGPDSAHTDLDEAWDIAEAGPMPLFMADIHLHRAGLFHHITPYPWQSPAFDAQEARHLIEKHGYLRRMGDLEVVEEALGIKANDQTATSCSSPHF
jgi:tetratricopeptide (TPR) repeat protein